MKKILLPVILSLLITSVGYCEGQLLQLTIKSDKEVYDLGESVTITLSLTNVSQNPIHMVTGFLEHPYSIRFTIEDEKGNSVLPLTIVDWIHGLPKEAITKLMPGTSIERSYILPQIEYPVNSDLGDSHRVYIPAKEGKYTIQVEYTNIDNAPETYGFKLWKGTIKSNELVIEVKGESLTIQTDKPTITISLDLIECVPEKLTEYGLNFPHSLTEVKSGVIQAGENIRDRLSRLKKDKDIKILYSTKVTTYPDNKVIVDNRQSLEYLAPEERNGITTFKKEIAYTGNLFEVNPNITKDGNISFTYNFWKGDFQCRISNNKDIPEELGYPINNVNSTNSRATLKDGETIITASMLKNTQTKSHTDAGDIIEKETKAFIYCFGADIKCAQNAPK